MLNSNDHCILFIWKIKKEEQTRLTETKNTKRHNSDATASDFLAGITARNPIKRHLIPYRARLHGPIEARLNSKGVSAARALINANLPRRIKFCGHRLTAAELIQVPPDLRGRPLELPETAPERYRALHHRHSPAINPALELRKSADDVGK